MGQGQLHIDAVRGACVVYSHRSSERERELGQYLGTVHDCVQVVKQGPPLSVTNHALTSLLNRRLFIVAGFLTIP